MILDYWVDKGFLILENIIFSEVILELKQPESDTILLVLEWIVHTFVDKLMMFIVFRKVILKIEFVKGGLVN